VIKEARKKFGGDDVRYCIEEKTSALMDTVEWWRNNLKEGRSTYGTRYLLKWRQTVSIGSVLAPTSENAIVVWGPRSSKDCEDEDGVAAREVERRCATAMKRCLLQAFDYLDYGDLLSCAQVCKLWRTVADDPRLWKRVFDNMLRSFAESQAYIPKSYPFIEGTSNVSL